MAIKNNLLSSTKLTQSLQLLTPKEFKSFGKWLQSPWANSNKKLVECYAFLQKHHPAFEAKKLTKENLFVKLYPDKKYDDKWMRNIMAAMTKQVEKFLIHQRLEKDGILAKQLLAKEYLQRHRNDWYVKQTDGIVKMMDGKEVKETEDYLVLAQMYDELYRQSEITQVDTDGRSLLQIAEVYLDTFYGITKWRYLTEMVERQFILPEEVNISDKMKRLYFMTQGYRIPVIDIYKERINLGSDLQKTDYFKLREKYLSQFDQLPIWDRKLLFFYFVNMLIRIWMRGDAEVVFELLRLYKFGMEKGLVFHYGRMSEATYMNIITTANSCGEFEYSKNLIDNYTKYLSLDNWKDGSVWATAHWHYHQDQFVKGIDLLVQHHSRENIFARYSKFLLVQCYFDACLVDDTYFSFFNDYCEAAKQYFRRNKTLSKERNEAHIKFIYYAHKIINLYYSVNRSVAPFQALVHRLEKENNIQGKKWLMSKIKEIIARLSS